MRYWWVNQNQTYKTEVRGSFMLLARDSIGLGLRFVRRFGFVSAIISICRGIGSRCSRPVWTLRDRAPFKVHDRGFTRT